ncbi:MAG TPA: V-type ATP synthase subunit D [Spirochaetota bacterium]|nr:V-type ATP synthase subunit D [Spirochaetota bacterium]HOL56024.1 V-type ATP synthase subunit D [Spirochaetota bacterium]HPP03466.1 V-type ATP synthase subunit D [Spirochaetota bacterium]
MALKYQFNKTAMQFLKKQLKIRENALPTLKSKESALRMTVKKEKENLLKLEEKYNSLYKKIKDFSELWGEFNVTYFSVKNINIDIKKIAGIKTPILGSVDYDIKEFSNFLNPVWFVEGINLLKELSEIEIEIEIQKKKIAILEYARKKTTQKVNLYEKVQIPEYSEAILKIKRYLEDVDNLEKSAQKITKQKLSSKGA